MAALKFSEASNNCMSADINSEKKNKPHSTGQGPAPCHILENENNKGPSIKRGWENILIQNSFCKF